MPAAIILVALLATLPAGCSTSGSNIKSTCVAGQHRDSGGPNLDDRKPDHDATYEGPTALTGWNRVGAAYLYNSKVRSSAYLASSNH